MKLNVKICSVRQGTLYYHISYICKYMKKYITEKAFSKKINTGRRFNFISL